MLCRTPDGSVSYTQGWVVDYTLPNSNPSYKYMPQDKFNQLFYDITYAIQNWQQHTIAPFITSAMNNGTPFSYSKYSMVLYGGTGYISLANSNTDTPPSANWAALNLNDASITRGRYDRDRVQPGALHGDASRLLACRWSDGIVHGRF